MEGEAMITDSRVPLAAFARSHAVPPSWGVTFGWGWDWWINQENGVRDDSPARPTLADVQRVFR
jgi:hypothetical protein